MNRLIRSGLLIATMLVAVLVMSTFSFAGTAESSVKVMKADEYKWSELKAGVDYVEDEILITFADEIESEDVIYAFAKQHNYADAEVISFGKYEGTKTALIKLQDGLTVENAIREIENDKLVMCAGPNMYVYRENTSVPEDTGYSWHIDEYAMPMVWELAKCEHNVTVAVLDGAVDIHHEDLEDNILSSYAWDAVNECALTSGSDAHATHVAGIISAVADNDLGVNGVSYNANIIPVNIFGDQGATTNDVIIRGYRYLLENVEDNRLKVINCSFGSYSDITGLEYFVNAASARGIITVCSSGNNNSTAPHYPSDYESCISVINVDQNGNKAASSNYGRLCDISAPGQEIISTLPGNDYNTGSGTSMAAPFVSGVIALMFAADPTLTNDQVKHYLYSTATDTYTEGRDIYSGWGIIDPYRAVSKAREGYWKRLYGSTRYDTMRAVSSEGWDDNSCDTVIVATGESFPDALAATSLAGIYNSPIILTSSTSLSQQAEGEIRRLGAENVIIAGGTGVVNNNVKNSISAIVGNGHVTRLAGTTRYDTAYSIYNNGAGSWSDTVIIATGMSAADVLSIAPYAYATHSPIFLADANGNLNSNMQAAITSSNFSKALIIGSSAIVSTSTENLVKSRLGSNNVYRLYGSSRYDTSSKIAKWESGEMSSATIQPETTLSYSNVGIANGGDDSFADALSGGALCGHNRSVMLLVTNDNTSSVVTINDNIRCHYADVNLGYAIGGPGVISDQLLSILENICMGGRE